MKKYNHYILSAFLTVFAALTFFLSGSVLFDLFGVRAQQGHYVLFVVITNFICSLLYFYSVYGLIKRKKWTTFILGMSLALLILVFAYFNIYIENGGIYEDKTYAAMIFRMAVTGVFTFLSYIVTRKKTELI